MEQFIIYGAIAGGLWAVWKIRKLVWLVILFTVAFLIIRGVQLSFPEVTIYMGMLAATIAAWKFARWLS